MKFTFFSDCISPHQVPLAKALIQRLGCENYRYVYTDELDEERKSMGWKDVLKEQGAVFIQGDDDAPEVYKADVLLSGHRAVGLFEKRNQLAKETWYCSERWFKPPLGFVRVFVPSYFKMAWRFVKCLKCETFKYLPMGIHAARDMARLVSFLSGDVRCFFAAPKVAFESRPGGAIVPLKEAIKAGVLSAEEITFGKQHGFVQIPQEQWGKVEPRKVYAKMRMWGYFVAPGKESTEYTEDTEKKLTTNDTNLHEKGAARETGNWELKTRNCREGASRLRVLWVGRMLKLKCVDMLVKACTSEALKDKVELYLYGHGPEEETLKALAKDVPIYFHDFVPVEQVRDLMRAHDVYVFSSNASDGWGAVVSEALEEGMQVFGTVEAGASGTVLPPTHLFKAGDVKRLMELLMAALPKVSIGEWTAENGAKYLCYRDVAGITNAEVSD